MTYASALVTTLIRAPVPARLLRARHPTVGLGPAGGLPRPGPTPRQLGFPRRGPRGASRTDAAGGRSRHNLPEELSSFVGRERDLERAQELLGATRLLTLLGTGGVGKTRLARRVAARVLADYPDGVWLVELAPLAEPAAVPQAVAAALGVREQRGRALARTLIDALRARTLLLVLDNCEHLVEACAALADPLLHACPGLRILATSREALRLSGEATWQVAPLAVPDPEHLPGLEGLPRYPAVRLFIDRAKLVAPDFALTETNAAAVAQVCSRLDGIPLALELAAARLRALSVAHVAERLDDRLRLLVGGSRAALPRQQTLRATLDWSVGLLSEPERMLLARLAVFAGGCSLEAAEAVCVDGPGHVAGVPIIDLLGRLVDKSLVMTNERAGQPRRYRLLETVRQYAAELLAAQGGGVEQRRRHRDWYLARAERVAPQDMDVADLAWLAREYDNVRSALRWSIEQGDPAAGLRLAAACWPFWHVQGRYAEGREWLAQLLALPGASTPGLARAAALNVAGHLAARQADHVAGQPLVEEALGIARCEGDPVCMMVSLMLLGDLAKVRGDLAAARSRYEQSRSVAIARGDRVTDAILGADLADVACQAGEYDRAAALAAECLAVFREHGHVWGKAAAQAILGRVARLQGDHAAARQHLEEALELAREMGDNQGMIRSLTDLAQDTVERGEDARARELFAEALGMMQASGDRRWLAYCLAGLAELDATLRPATTVALAAAADALRRELPTPPPANDQQRLARCQQVARRRLGGATFDRAWAEARAMPTDQVLALALAAARQRTAGPARRAADGEHRPEPGMPLREPLSERERDVLHRIAAGQSNQEIAGELVVQVATVKTHINNLYRKLDVHSRTQAVARAGQLRLLLTP